MPSKLKQLAAPKLVVLPRSYLVTELKRPSPSPSLRLTPGSRVFPRDKWKAEI